MKDRDCLVAFVASVGEKGLMPKPELLGMNNK